MQEPTLNPETEIRKLLGEKLYEGEKTDFTAEHIIEILAQAEARARQEAVEEERNKPCACECHDDFMKRVADSGDSLNKLLSSTKEVVEALSSSNSQRKQVVREEKFSDEAFEKGLTNFRKLRLVTYEPLMDEAPPAETVLSVLKKGLGGMFNDQAVRYIYKKAVDYYLKSLNINSEDTL